MNTIHGFIKKSLAALALAVGLALCAAPAWAIDRLVLNDGSVVEGTIVRETDGFVWIKVTVAGIAQEKMFTPQEIKSVQREAGSAPAPSAPVMRADIDGSKTTPRPGVTRAAIVTYGSRDPDQGDMVGVDVQAWEFEQMIPMLEEEIGNDRSGVVVIRITSGGGAVSEIAPISDMLHNQYKKRFRVVTWIDSAISAAAMSTHCVEEIYFTPQGNYGACTGWSGQLKQMTGRPWEALKLAGEKFSIRGGYDPKIMLSMQEQIPLSASIDQNGQVTFYQDATSGEILVNRDNEILTFNAESAARVKFSKGTASDYLELGRLMGYKEIEWVGKFEKGYPWPICKAEKWNLDWRRKVHKDQENLDLYWGTYQAQFAAAASEPRETRAKFVNIARATLNKIREAAKRNPNMAQFVFGVYTQEEVKEWFDEQEKRLRDLMR